MELCLARNGTCEGDCQYQCPHIRSVVNAYRVFPFSLCKHFITILGERQEKNAFPHM